MASQLLQLPRELREYICLIALQNTYTPISLLTTCHQLNMEAQPLLYHRPIKHSSQSKLFEWIKRSRAQNLKHVRSLTLHLTDIDLQTILLSPNRRPPTQPQHQNPNQKSTQPPPQHHQITPTAYSLYELELSHLDSSLRALPNLAEITLVPPRAMHSQLLRGMYLSLLALIPRLHPGLKLLVVHDDAVVLDIVTALRDLPKVLFKGSHGGKEGAEGRGKKAVGAAARCKVSRGREVEVKVEREES